MNKKYITFEKWMSNTRSWKQNVEEETTTQPPWKEMHPLRRRTLEEKVCGEGGRECGGGGQEQSNGEEEHKRVFSPNLFKPKFTF